MYVFDAYCGASPKSTREFDLLLKWLGNIILSPICSFDLTLSQKKTLNQSSQLLMLVELLTKIGRNMILIPKLLSPSMLRRNAPSFLVLGTEVKIKKVFLE